MSRNQLQYLDSNPPAFYECLNYFNIMQERTGIPFTQQHLMECVYSRSRMAPPPPKFVKPPKKKSWCTILQINEIEYDNQFLQNELAKNGSLEKLIDIHKIGGMEAINNNLAGENSLSTSNEISE